MKRSPSSTIKGKDATRRTDMYGKIPFILKGKLSLLCTNTHVYMGLEISWKDT